MWGLDCEESWTLKNGCFWTVVLEKTLESPLDCKEIQPVHSKGDQSWEFTGRIDVKAETPVLWPPHVKSWLIGKDSDAGRDWGQEKGRTEDEMAGWHHRLQGREFEWTQEVGDRQRGLVCCDSWGCKKSDTTEPLNWTEPQEEEERVLGSAEWWSWERRGRRKSKKEATRLSPGDLLCVKHLWYFQYPLWRRKESPSNDRLNFPPQSKKWSPKVFIFN